MSPLASSYNWSGCSVGANVGGVWGNNGWTDKQPGDANFGVSEGSHSPSGVSGGLQVGCDYQFAGNIVLGLQGDFNLTNAKASHADLIGGAGFTDKSQTNWYATVAPRIGYAFDRFLPYVKGGVAFENLDVKWTGPALSGTGSQTRTGWMLGLGGEYAVTQQVTVFLEYNYLDFGKKDATFAVSDGTKWVSGIDESKSVVKAGVNWRF